MGMNFGTWNVGCLSRSRSSMTVERELSKYRFSLLETRKIIWDKGDLELADDYVFRRV
jgi:hypothetical protein